MAVTAKYSKKPLQVVETEAKKARIKAIADREGISQADVVRDLIEHGLGWREQVSQERADILESQ